MLVEVHIWNSIIKHKHILHIVKFKHTCRMCNVEMKLNLTVMKRHLDVQHKTTVENYLGITLYIDEFKSRMPL